MFRTKFSFFMSVLASTLFFLLAAQSAHAEIVTIASGTVTYPDGSPAADVQMSIQGPSGSGFNDVTDASGNYALADDSANLQNGSYQINMSAPASYIKPVSLPYVFSYTSGDPAEDYDMELIDAPKQIHVTVRDTSGNLITSAQINSYTKSTDTVSANSQIEEDGTTTLYASGELSTEWIVSADANLSSYAPDPDDNGFVAIEGGKKVTFAADATEETEELEFTVADSRDYLVNLTYLDTDGDPYSNGTDQFDVIYTGYNKDYGTISTKRKISPEGDQSIYLLPGVWRFNISADSAPDGKSIDPRTMTFVVPDAPGEYEMGSVQLVDDVSSISGVVSVRTFDESGNPTDTPTEGVDVNIINTDTGFREVRTTAANGIITFFDLPLGTYNLSANGDGMIPLSSATATLTSDQQTVAGLQLLTTEADLTITGSVKIGATPVENVPASVVLQGDGQTFSAPIQADGSYELQTYQNGFSGTPELVVSTLPGADVFLPQPISLNSFDGQTELEQDLQVNDNEKIITGNIHNQADETIDADTLGVASVSAVNLTSGSIEEVDLADDGSYSLSVGDGDWTIVPKLEFSNTSLQAPGSSNQVVSITPDTPNSQELNLPVLETPLVVTGSVTDPDGSPIPEAPVVLTNLPALQSEAAQTGGTVDPADIISLSTMSDNDGTISVNVPANQEFTVYYGTNPDIDQHVEPLAQTITVEEENVELETAEYREATATLSGTVPEDLTMANVTIYSPEGGSQTVEPNQEGAFTIPVLPGDWQVAVSGVQDNELMLGQTDVSVAEGTTTLDPEVTATGIDFPAAVSETGSADEAMTITNTAGAMVSLPAYAAGYSGDIRVDMAPESSVVFVNGVAQVGLAYNINVLDSSGFSLTTLSLPATVSLPLDESLLQGSEPEEVQGSYYQPDLGTYLYDGIVAGATDDHMVIQTSHFTRFAATTIPNDETVQDSEENEVVLTKPGKPRALNAKKITDTTALLNWKKPRNSTVGKYKLQVREFKVKKQKQWDTYNKVERTKKRVKKLDAQTRYQFRVRACNSQGCSKFTKWETFRTKH